LEQRLLASTTGDHVHAEGACILRFLCTDCFGRPLSAASAALELDHHARMRIYRLVADLGEPSYFFSRTSSPMRIRRFALLT
jgi:hypothetical protein